jgi:predicted AlkP superfamily pyrophosphatase or phosphodiesterase
MATSLVLAQSGAPVPKLVVGVVVDQMRFDHLQMYGSRFGPNGFNRLLREGFNYTNSNYRYIPTFTAPGHASIYTGTGPAFHGIIGNSWFERAENKVVISVEDSTELQVGTKVPNTFGLSPRRLMVNTIADELREATNNKAKVISVSLKDRAAILPGGLTANASYWYDWESSPGYFVSSTYYMEELPRWVTRFNHKEKSDSFLNLTWETRFPIATYRASAEDNSPYERAIGGKETPTFPYDFRILREKYRQLGTEYQLLWLSPYGNSLLTEFALEALAQEELGKDDIPDMLLISYTVTDVVGHTLGQQSVEMEDVMLRLDQNIAELLEKLDQNPGKENYLFFLTSDHGAIPNGSRINGTGLPAGVASIGRYKIALAQFLTQGYGEQDWITYFDNEQVYLNRKVISEQKLDLREIQEKSAAFLKTLEGIADALPANQLQTRQFEEGMRRMLQNGYQPTRSGDILLIYEIGFVPDQRTNLRIDQVKGSSHGSGYSYDTHVPQIWFGRGISHGVSDRNVSGVDIAPTLARFLNLIPAENATGKPLRELLGGMSD